MIEGAAREMGIDLADSGFGGALAAGGSGPLSFTGPGGALPGIADLGLALSLLGTNGKPPAREPVE